MKYVELYFDAEGKQEWCITVWDINQKDFDPMTSDYEVLPTSYKHIHEAKRAQETLVGAYRLLGETVYMNTYNQDAFFWIKPRWMEEMLAAIAKTRIISDEYTKGGEYSGKVKF